MSPRFDHSAVMGLFRDRSGRVVAGWKCTIGECGAEPLELGTGQRVHCAIQGCPPSHVYTSYPLLGSD